ncbi:hypothetical protein RCL_jg22457.t1 [Rhizophagus clarus]|uniref:Uncharacterized protein n=1 Tax=Rhizophagus clarus TaxID=94130 RepID=A0A8H3R489_9GLOM|nr:hypothetical protein RCL_jg22457.t1 [Rhizophagus clarus]
MFLCLYENILKTYHKGYTTLCPKEQICVSMVQSHLGMCVRVLELNHESRVLLDMEQKDDKSVSGSAAASTIIICLTGYPASDTSEEDPSELRDENLFL